MYIKTSFTDYQLRKFYIKRVRLSRITKKAKLYIKRASNYILFYCLRKVITLAIVYHWHILESWLNDCLLFFWRQILYYLTHQTLKRIQTIRGVIGPRQYNEARRVRNRGILYCSVFIICWTPGTQFLASFDNLRRHFPLRK